ncbi:glycosyl transferase [Leptolyngbyaceae cyanobacterium JSC-12]|nr:glycosyl transferase [Leptolyngbyaceae cyanobacterium JSC-12]
MTSHFLIETFAICLNICLVVALLGTIAYWRTLHQMMTEAPQLQPSVGKIAAVTKVSVIIPAYNEADNIEDCVRSVLQSSDWTSDRLEVWVVDDQSTDGTLEIVQMLQTTLADPRLRVFAGAPRPAGELWMGKNWACHQVAQEADGEFLLFLDADVRLKSGAIETAIAIAQQEKSDLLTCWPGIVCDCFAEWLAQPLIGAIILASLPFTQVNDPASDIVFAVGPFMLFRRVAYDQIGGHRAVADQVVEDVELARRIKQKGLKLYYALGHNLGTLRMYRSGAALWEGWTKNWYLGSRRNLAITLYGALMTFWICALPLMGLVGLTITGAIAGFSWAIWAGITIALLTILWQYPLRLAIQALSTIPPRYWWLTGLGGIFVTAIMLASIIKTQTGWGWTWRGRPLQLPNE